LIRAALDRWMSPAVERVLCRVERGVAPPDQWRLALSLLEGAVGPRSPAWLAALDPPARGATERLCAVLAAELGDAAAVDADANGAGVAFASTGASLLEVARREAAPPAWPLHLATLSGCAADPAAALPLGAELQAAAARETAPDVAPAGLAPLTLCILAAVRAGALSRSEGARIVGELVRRLPPRRWFGRAGTPYGIANLVRALVEISGEDATCAEALSDATERLLRHVEIRRQTALSFPAAARLSPGQARLERLRFTLACLEIAVGCDDLRFLNAALKLNDWHHGEVVRLARGGPPWGTLLAVHWGASVAGQERAMRRMLP
jgi:hypothetical protein